MTYLDEVLGLCGFLVLIMRGKLFYWKFIVQMVIVGIISLWYSYYEQSTFKFAFDVFNIAKPFLIYLFFKQLRIHDELNTIILFGKAYLLSALLLLPVHWIFHIFLPGEIRFGLESYSFYHNNPGEFGNVLTVIIGLIMMSYRSRTKFILLGIFLLMTTLRFKSFVIASFIIVLTMTDIVNWDFGKLRYKLYGLVVLLLLAVPGYSQFTKYFLSDDMTPRLIFLVDGWKLSYQHFPFGVGPGLFGSSIAKMYYSQVYVDLGWSSFWGLGNNGNGIFLNDNFWPIIFVQYGFIGLLIFFVFLKRFGRSVMAENYIRKVDVLVFGSLLLSSLGSSIFFSSLGALYMALLAASAKT